LPDLDRRAIARRRTADADAFRVVATVAEGGAATGADPFAAAGVFLLLFLETLTEHVHELVPAMLFQGRLFLGRERLLKLLHQPVQGDFLALRVLGGDLDRKSTRLNSSH